MVRIMARSAHGHAGLAFSVHNTHPSHHLMDIIRLIFAILLPPVGVFLQVGIGLQFWINILLTIFGYVPGIIHAVYIIVTRD